LAGIEGIFVGGPKSLRDERGDFVSSIVRKRVDGPIHLSIDGFEGDKVTQPYHGGSDAAVCVHLVDHYDFWRAHYGMDLPHGHLGENLVLSEVKEDDVCAGDVIRAGSALLQVSGPRVPCETQARRAGRTDWVKLTIRENRTGFYLRVLEPGIVEVGDAWRIEQRIHPQGSIPAINRCLYLDFDPEVAQAYSEMQGLAEWWREQFREKLARTKGHWSDEILQPAEASVQTAETEVG